MCHMKSCPHPLRHQSPDWLKVLTPTDPSSARKDHSAGVMDAHYLNSVIICWPSVGWAKDSDFQMEHQNLFLPWQNDTVFHQLQEHYLRAAQFPEPGVLLFFESLRSEHLLPRDASLHLFISQGKTTHGFPVAAVSAVVSDVCWGLSAGKRMLKKGTVHLWKWGALPLFLNVTLELELIVYFCCFFTHCFLLSLL